MSTADLGATYLDSVCRRFESLKRVGEGALAQVADTDLDWAANPECNSLRLQIQHLHGNMLSRWTDPLTTDGEKPTRQRDAEFQASGAKSRDELMAAWEKGWKMLLDALGSFTTDDLTKTIYIRGEAHSLLDAINRQLMHVAYHVGQIVQIGKERVGDQWKSLSIPRGKSKEFNASKANAWNTQ
jgi:hypothetical protein